VQRLLAQVRLLGFEVERDVPAKVEVECAEGFMSVRSSISFKISTPTIVCTGLFGRPLSAQ
jgi:hypothetical protein